MSLVCMAQHHADECFDHTHEKGWKNDCAICEVERLRGTLERNWIHDAWCKSFYAEPCNCMDAALGGEGGEG